MHAHPFYTQAYVCVRAISGWLRSSQPSYIRASRTHAWCPSTGCFLRNSPHFLIGLSLRESPDTLNPIGSSIFHFVQVEPGPFRGPSAKNLFSLCSCGGSRPPLGAFPPHPPFTSAACQLMLFSYLPGVKGVYPLCRTAGPKGRGPTLRESFSFHYR